MNILKLKINSYGKLKDKEINLKEGINLIHGKNEAGKSTLINFIISSFYGISKNKGKKEYLIMKNISHGQAKTFLEK